VLHQHKDSIDEALKVNNDLNVIINRLRDEMANMKNERNTLRNDKMSSTKGLNKYEEVVQLKDDKIDLF